MKEYKYYFESSKQMIDIVKEIKRKVCLQLVELDTSDENFDPCDAGMATLAMCDVEFKLINDYDAVAQNTASKIASIKSKLEIAKKLAAMRRK